MKRHTLSGILLGLVLVGAIATQGLAAPYVLRFAGVFSPTHPATRSMEAFKACLEKASGGQIEVQLYPNSQFGGEEQLMDLVRRNSVQIALVGGLIKRDEPRIAAMEAPFLIDDWVHAKRVYGGRGGEILAGNYTKNTDVYIKGWFVNGFRQISSRAPVDSMADFAGMKMRTPLNDVLVRVFKAFGATTVVVPMDELAIALENGVVDGQDNPYSTVRAAGLYEMQSYLLESRHIFSVTAVLVNGNFFDDLPADLQTLVDACLKDAVDLNWKLSEEDEASSRTLLEAKGLKIHAPSPELLRQMKEAVRPVHDWFTAEIPGAREFLEYCRSVE